MIDHALIQQWLLPDSVILTPNQRLSEFISAEINRWHYQQGEQVWTSTAVFPLEAWLKQLWQTAFQQQLVPPQLLLNDKQTHVLWGQLLGKTDGSLVALADTAQKAWQLTQQWQLAIDSNDFSYNEDTAAWQQWATQWQQNLIKQEWLDIPLLHQQILTTLPLLAKHQQLPKQIYVVNFIQYTPWQKMLFADLEKLGIIIEHQQTQVSDPIAYQLACEQSEIEVRQMAQWALTQIQHKKRIGCLFAATTLSYQKIKQIFTEYLPDTHLWDLGLKRNLSDFSFIQHALLLLQLLLPEISAATISQLLLSPFISDGLSQFALRAQMDFAWRRDFAPLLSRQLLRRYIIAKKKGCQIWRQKFLEVTAYETAIKQSPRQWLVLFEQVWQIFAWPGDRALTSEEYQLQQQWHVIKQDFASLDLVQTQLSVEQAINGLTRLTEKTAFYAKSTTTPRVFVDTLLAAVGLPFDAIWVAGMQDEAMPPVHAPNPFIPYPLQQQHGLPYASPQQTQAFSERVMAQLTNTTSEIIFSYATHEGEKLMRPSPLIATLPVKIMAAVTANDIVPPTWEFYDDNTASVNNLPDKTYGSELFKDQASCPFRAFAKYRLYAPTLITPTLGLTYSQRGQLLHRSLETIWQHLQSQQALLTLTAIEMRDLIATQVQSACQQFIGQYFLPTHFFKLEQRRLAGLISRWLAHEKARPTFIVAALEKKLSVHFAGLALELRIDRIDQLPDEQYLLLDYKSGKCSANAWLEPRLEESQLPLYSLVSTLPVSQLAYGQLHPEAVCFKELSARYAIASLKSSWQQQLTHLAEEYQQGYAAVLPRKQAETCKFCDLSVLCRVKF